MVDDLAERLKSHEDAFQSLLSLIPSKLYYAQEAQTQWKKRKQTPEEMQQAKRAKLDPDQTNSAARRPADLAVEATVVEDGENSGLTRSQIKNRAKKVKKLRAIESSTKKESEKEKTAVEDKGKLPATENRPVNGTVLYHKTDQRETAEGVSPKTTKPPTPRIQSTKPNGVPSTINGTPLPSTSRVLTNGIKSSPSPSVTGTPRSPSIPIISSPIPEQQSSPSSIAELRAKVAARIAQSRVARKAIGTPGGPQTREAILEARAKRKAIVEAKINAKKEAKKKLLQQTQPTPNDIKQDDSSSEDEMAVDNGLSFGRVLVNDTEIDVGKAQVKLSKQKKSKGTSDPKSRLQHLEVREKKVAKMDPEKAHRTIENERWHHALLSARGEKVKDDISLLKKTISRRERDKKKSKREWDERIAKVERGKEERQRKREENIAKRRAEKGRGGKKAGKPKKGFVVKKKKRPGFEGGRIKVGSK